MEIGKQHGFTLIELMITVAVVAILSALAYPSFQGAMMKNRRAAAQAYLSDVAQKQQQYLMDARAYTNDNAVLKVTQPADVTRYYDRPSRWRRARRLRSRRLPRRRAPRSGWAPEHHPGRNQIAA